MNVQDFTHLIEQPETVVASEHAEQLADIINEYPYFQVARVLHLKALKTSNSFKYNNALKTAAAYTTDREILFDFITSPSFNTNKENTVSEEKTTETKAEKETLEIIEPTKTPEVKIVAKNTSAADTLLDPLLFTPKEGIEKISESKGIQEEENEEEAFDLQIGEPLNFTITEKHSFAEWLQLAGSKNNEEDPSPKKTSKPKVSKKEKAKKSKFDLIDKFIDENPKIVPQKNTPPVDIKSSIQLDKTELMTETLAKVYLEQKKYKNAIQAYKILSLKYPEKSSFFADRIKAVEKIKKENTP